MTMRLGFATVLVLLPIAAPASASTVAVTGGVMTYTGSAGFGHDIRLDLDSPGVVNLTRDTPTLDVITAGAGCVADTPGAGQFQCSGVTSVALIGAERADSMVWNGSSPVPTTLTGGAGADELVGAAGADTVNGGAGSDALYGLGGDDALVGGTGGDTLFCGTGIDQADGGSGNDSFGCGDSGVPPAANGKAVTGGPGNDNVTTGEGNDTIDTGPGSDSVNSAGYGADTVDLGAGDDSFSATADATADVYTGGPGDDTAYYDGHDDNVSLSLDGVANDGAAGEADNIVTMENLTGGAGDDTLTGDGNPNAIYDIGGSNVISGGGGDDALTGASGPDTINGGDGNDRLLGRDDDDRLDGGAGNDHFVVDAGADAFFGGAGNDTVDVTRGGCSRSLRACRRGGGFSGYVSRVLSLDGIANDGVGNEGDNIDADGSVENVLGGDEDDVITGNAAVNILSGGGGSDLIDAGDRTLLTDIVSCGTGPDAITVDQFDSWDTRDSERCESVSKTAIVKAQPTLTAKTAPRARRFAPYRFVTSGRLSAPSVPNRFACPDGTRVRVWIKAGNVTIASHVVRLAKDCTYATQFSFRGRSAFHGQDTLTVRAGYAGGRYLFAAAADPGSLSVP